ncbi:Peptidase S28 [Cynara cardunculus var. scolymus]|uniref:Peptidase S28 n=1 Tax=Cynara cardunculus var. scolymus TaxID=59895 RepID=A0A103XH20_CYNCS|nr:Peptidase S28 [Cynara cardunculus var. scolymus]
MPPWLLPFFSSLIFSQSITSSFAKFPPWYFPSSMIRPETPSSPDKNELYKTKYFTQILDHFNYNPQSYQTFQQRYLINDTFWGGPKTKAPIFVYTGNEGNIEWFAQNTGFMFDIAPEFKALLVFIEHRYYGKSIPYGGDRKKAYKNSKRLGFLSSTQALADYATLIIDLKNNLTAMDSAVIVFGGSYGGMLAAWFRLKYPHVAIGALSSSSPILQFENITSQYTFNNIITQDFRSESENCYKVIKGLWREIEDTAGWLSSALVYVSMTDYPTPSNFIAPLPAYPIKQAIDDPTLGNDTFAKMYQAANIYYNYTGDVKCFDLDDDSDPHDLGGWQWQACTEMVMPISGNKEESIFPASTYSYTDHVKYCEAAYEIQPRPTWITTEFGGHDITRVLKRFGSNIIFFNGLRDPWSGGGVLNNISKSIIAIVAEKGAHHVDLRFSTDKDPDWLRDVRKREIGIMKDWISEYYHMHSS